MFLRYVVLASAISMLVVTNDARAQTATQVVRFEVNAINQVAVSGNPAPLVINSATAGNAPAPVTGVGTTYAVTTNESNQKITASIDHALPSGVTLEVTLSAPTGASSVGAVQLTTAGADVVTGISSANASLLPITYRLSATAAAQMSAPEARTVTFTIVSGT
ncbi:MAG TPA: hypothetical protein VIF32_00595 [Gemmatimonadaceae bacterium]|jgi:hypothetical protein